MIDPRLKEKILEDLEKIEDDTLSCMDIAKKYDVSKSIVYKLQEEVRVGVRERPPYCLEAMTKLY